MGPGGAQVGIDQDKDGHVYCQPDEAHEDKFNYLFRHAAVFEFRECESSVEDEILDHGENEAYYIGKKWWDANEFDEGEHYREVGDSSEESDYPESYESFCFIGKAPTWGMVGLFMKVHC